MEDWVLWMIAAVVLGAGEIATLSFFLGPIAIAAVLAAGVAVVGGPVALQFAVFVAVSVLSLLVIRPLARRHLKQPANIRTGAAALVGERALVLERVHADGGQVKLGGEVWTARPYDEDDVIEAGTRAQVLKIEGATALISE
jgi:membrane protein implicated in regulation of membrane protease activity